MARFNDLRDVVGALADDAGAVREN